MVGQDASDVGDTYVDQVQTTRRQQDGEFGALTVDLEEADAFLAVVADLTQHIVEGHCLDLGAIEWDDDTFKDAGKVGVWTKADSVTLFDDFNYGEK